jgi:outer membrane receptor protein involved in Fe transport
MIKSLVATGCVLAAAPAALAAPPSAEAVAAAPGDAAAAKARESSLAELVVTATRREVALQRLPAAVTAISSQRLDDLNAQSFQDYFRTVPGLMYNSLGPGLNRFDFTIRGVSSFSQLIPVENATVGEYLDDIPVTAVGQQVDPRLVDLERIEILRGPQGTYFGEDSLSGTVRIITKKPSFDGYSALAEGRLSWTRSGGANHELSAIVNAPLVDGVLAFRGNAFVARDSGFIDGVKGGCKASDCTVDSVEQRNLNPGRDYGLRGLMLWQPADRVSLLAEAMHGRSHESNAAIYEPRVGDLRIIAEDTNAGPGPGGPPGGGGGPMGGSTNGGGPGGGGPGSGGPGGALPSGDVGGLGVIDRYSLYSLTGRAKLPAAELVATSSLGRRDVDTGPPDAPDDVAMTYKDFAQEVRLQSDSAGRQGWDYTAGLYYQDHRKASAQAGAGAPRVMSEHITDQAAFGDLGRRAGALTVRFGLRQQLVLFHRSANAAGPVAATSSSGHNAATTGRVVASYELSPSALVYASASRGFRRGGLNAAFPGVPAAYRPDHTTDYEVGWKLSSADHGLFVSGDLFTIRWDDIQVAQLASAGTGQQQYYANGGAAQIDGVELEGGAALLPGLETRFSFAWLDPRLIDDQPGGACARGCPGRKGDRIPYVSRSTASLSLDYKRPLGDGRWRAFGDLSEQFASPRNTDFSPTAPGGAPNPVFRRLPSSWLTNVQIGLASPDWQLSLFVDNLFDRRNVYSATPSFSPSGGNGDQVLVDRPRTTGIWLRRAF